MMTELATNIGTIWWWVSAIVVGVLINIASEYLKKGVDGTLSRFSSYRRERSEKAKEEYRKEIEELKKSKELQRQYEHHEIRTRLEALLAIVFAVMFLAYKAVAKMYPETSTANLVGIPDSVSGAIFTILIAILTLGSIKLYLRAEAVEEKLAIAQRRAGAKQS